MRPGVFAPASRLVLPLAAVFVASGCTENGRTPQLTFVETAPPTETNFNIDDPTLSIAENDQVSPGDALTLVWSDEFEGSQLDPEMWFFETGDGSQYGIPRWGNNELQWYLPDSAQLSGGVLTITADRKTYGTFEYSSARINTQDRFAFRYGRVEARMKLPPGQGIWPAFWLLSQDSPYGEWAATGEIDIMEAVNLDGSGGNEILGTLHYGGFGSLGQNVFTGNAYTPSTDVTEQFHVYAVEWDETEIRWYVDDTMYAMQNSWSSTQAPFPAPFDQPFYIIFNVAVGGNLPGSPTDDTAFPVTMEVDWVRVYSGEP